MSSFERMGSKDSAATALNIVAHVNITIRQRRTCFECSTASLILAVQRKDLLFQPVGVSSLSQNIPQGRAELHLKRPYKALMFVPTNMERVDPISKF